MLTLDLLQEYSLLHVMIRAEKSIALLAQALAGCYGSGSESTESVVSANRTQTIDGVVMLIPFKIHVTHP